MSAAWMLASLLRVTVGGNTHVIKGQRAVPVSPKFCIPFEIYLMRLKQEYRSQDADARC